MFRLFEFLTGWRSLPWYELASYPLMFASVPMLASAGRPPDGRLVMLIIPTVLSLYAGFFAALIVNDLTDADIDAVAHPGRPIPSGRVSVRGFVIAVLVCALLSFALALAISGWCLLVVVGTFAFALVHDKYLKRGIKIPGYSEFFGSTQWIAVGVFGYLAVWSRAPLSSELLLLWPFLGPLQTSTEELINMLLLAAFIYFSDTWHDIPEGIHDIDGDREAGVTTFALSFGERTAARMAFGIFVVSGFVGVALFMRTHLSLFFLVGFAALFGYTAQFPYKLMRMNSPEEMRAAGPKVGRKGFDYFLFCFNLMFIDLLGRNIFALI